MPRFPLYPRLCRAAALSLAVSGIVATGAPAAVASPLMVTTPAPLSIPAVNPPVVNTPAVSTPAVSTPATSTPAVSTPAVSAPAAAPAPSAPAAAPTTTSSFTTTGAASIPGLNPSSTQSGGPGPSNSLVWNGDLSTNSFSQYPWLWACPGGVTLTPSVTYKGEPSAKFTVDDTSNSSYCPGHVFTHNPASSLITPNLFGNGDDRYISFATMFPAGFPYITNWLQVGEIFGPPYGGSPTIGIDVERNQLGLWRDGTHHFDNPWHTTVQIGQWMNVTLHVKFSPNPSVGFVELWLNGVQQHFTNGSTRLYYATLLTGDNWNGSTKNVLDLDQYRGLTPSLGSISIYHAAAKIGMSLASVSS